MRSRSQTLMLLWLALLCGSMGCGTKIGNPTGGSKTTKVNEDQPSPNPTPQPSPSPSPLPQPGPVPSTNGDDVFLPQFNLVRLEKFFDESILSLLLQSSDPTEVQEDVKRVSDAFSKVTDRLKELNEAGLNKLGRQNNVGQNSDLLVDIQFLEKSGDSSRYQAVICLSSQANLEMRWNHLQTELTIIHQYKTEDSSRGGEDQITVEINLQQTENTQNINAMIEETDLQSGDGGGRGGNNGPSDRDNKLRLIKIAANDLEQSFKAVKSNFGDNKPENGSFEADEYLLGVLTTDSDGEFVQWKKGDQGCVQSFDEQNPGQSWCGGGAITDASTIFNSSQLAEAITRLSQREIVSQAELRSVIFTPAAESICNP